MFENNNILNISTLHFNAEIICLFINRNLTLNDMPFGLI